MASNSQDCSDPSPPKRLKLDEISSISHISSVESDSVQFGVNYNAVENPEEASDNQNLETTEKITDENLLLELLKSSSESNSPGPRDDEDADEEEEDGDDNNEDNDDEEDDDDFDVASTVSNISDLSGISEMSGQDWNCIAGQINWLQRQMKNGADPRTILGNLFGDKFYETKCSLLDKFSLWRLIASVLSEPPQRAKLPSVNTFSHVIQLLKTCKKVVVLTGAGVPASCGIPDFRSRNGVYSRLAVDFPDLPDPQSMFDIDYFRRDPRPFFKFAREIYPGQFKPSPCHRFIKKLEDNGKLLRNYTQNIDTLEQVAGIKNVVECHGSFATATCTRCQHKVTCEDIREAVFQQKIPFCPICPTNPEDPGSLPSHVPQILINRESLPDLNFDVELLGDGDVIINQICLELGDNWTDVCWTDTKLTETKPSIASFQRSGYNTEYSEGEISVDWSSPSDRTVQLDSTSVSLMADASMEQEDEEEEEEEETKKEEGPAEENRQTADDACGDCGKDTSQPTIKCRKIRKIKVRNKMAAECASLPTNQKEDDRLFGANDTDGRMSVEQEDGGATSAGLVSRRHLSTDSTRDSGIGDGSNSSSLSAAERHMSVDSQLLPDDSDHMSPINVASTLPENSYFYIRPNRYIFHGAEVTVDDPSELLSDAESTTNCETSSTPQLTIDRQQLKEYLSVAAHDSRMWGTGTSSTSPDDQVCRRLSSTSHHNLSSTT
ncbi:hypothetical protein LSTR_LSTR012657 [Laodelphax striatellus]|uniref:protein acetyllysine N-acetyltransferase n=1 Tax=Laodelphax striatellus TaxID=195883 RepID=A0A482WGU7_LAOST|nr:hypothetical protein LSTR_LSTR012657 [Laodelphax striatellus]